MSYTCSLVGREREIARLHAALSRPGAVVSLYGQSGIGKTSLLREFATSASREHGRVVLIDCADLRSGDHVASEVASRVGEKPEEDLLVLLDHVDGLHQSIPELVASLPSPRRCVVAGVLPMAVGASAALAVEPLTDSAEELFVHRVQEISPDFRVDEVSAPLVTSLVRRLGGIPLAIELAAARYGLLGLPELVRLTETADEVLGALGKASSPRNLSMSAALRWTLAQLDPAQRAFLAEMTAFEEAVDPAAMAAISDAELAEVLDHLSALVDLRLVEPVERPGPETSGRTCFRLRPLVARVARDHLPADRARTLASRHARHFVSRAAREADLLLEGRESDADPALPGSLGEIRGAVGFLQRKEDRVQALALAADLTVLLAPRAEVEATATLLESLLVAVLDAHDDVPESILARAQLAAAASRLALANASDETRPAMALWERGLQSAKASDARAALWAHSIRVRALPVTGDFEGAAASARSGMAIAAQSGYPIWQARFEAWAGMVHHMLGDYPRAVELGERALTRSLATGDRYAQIRVGLLLHQIPEGHWAGNPLLPSFETLLGYADELHDPNSQGFLLVNIVVKCVRDGDLEGAATHLARLLEGYVGARGSRESATALVTAALWASARGLHSDVARLFGAAKPWEEVVFGAIPPAIATAFRARLETARQILGSAAFDAALATGAHAPMDDNVAHALDLVAHDRTRQAEPLPEAPSGLTPREIQVLGLLVSGRRNKEIAVHLGVSAKTVMHHTGAIYRKLGVRGRAEAAALAVREQLITPS